MIRITGDCCAILIASLWLMPGCIGSTSENLSPREPFQFPSGQNYEDQWALPRVGFTYNTQHSSVRKNVIQSVKPVLVAVIDSGLDYLHPGLNPADVWRNAIDIPNGRDDDANGYVDDLIGWNFADGNNNPWDNVGHGTLVAGIIAEVGRNGKEFGGLNPRVKIMPLKILNAIGRGRATALAEAIFYAVARGARVINLSMGGEGISKTEQLALNYAHSKGVVVVVSAGNLGRDASSYGPAGISDVITVAATDFQDKRAGSSNWGKAVDISAPGVDIVSLRARRTDVMRTMGIEGYKPGSNFVGPEDRYYRASGTSFAAAFVSGAAALLLSKNPKLTNVEVKRLLLMSADDVEAPGWDQLTGYGRLNVAKALAADPNFFLDARIHKLDIVKENGRTVLRVYGVADANQFKQAWLELGVGESPTEWRKVSDAITKNAQSKVLAHFPATALRGSEQWILRLVVEHTNGQRREARHSVNVR